MDLNYNDIFILFINMCSTAIPIAIFLHILNLVISLFFSLAFPKFYKRGE